MDTTPAPAKPPIGYGISVLAAASVLPVILLVDATMGPGGDGYGGAGAMVLYFVLALVLSVGGAIAGARRGERFHWLAYVALALWILPFAVLM